MNARMVLIVLFVSLVLTAACSKDGLLIISDRYMNEIMKQQSVSEQVLDGLATDAGVDYTLMIAENEDEFINLFDNALHEKYTALAYTGFFSHSIIPIIEKRHEDKSFIEILTKRTVDEGAAAIIVDRKSAFSSVAEKTALWIKTRAEKGTHYKLYCFFYTGTQTRRNEQKAFIAGLANLLDDDTVKIHEFESLSNKNRVRDLVQRNSGETHTISALFLSSLNEYAAGLAADNNMLLIRENIRSSGNHERNLLYSIEFHLEDVFAAVFTKAASGGDTSVHRVEANVWEYPAAEAPFEDEVENEEQKAPVAPETD